MKNALFALLAVLLAILGTLVAAEGIYALAIGSKERTSLTYQALQVLGVAREPKRQGEGVYAPFFSDPEELRSLVDPLREAGIGVGNQPYRELHTAKAAFNVEVDGCIGLKPNLRKIAFYLRSNAFHPLDPIAVFYDEDKILDERLASFFERYGTPPVIISTTAWGERTTLPPVERTRKVLIVGDSVAFGAMIDDADTLASQLQSRDSERQYVNLAVSGLESHEVLCRLEASMQRYAGQVDELIYVFCANDIDTKGTLPYGQPEEVVAWLRDFVQRQGISKVTVVFAPYIYSIAPEVTRFKNFTGYRHPLHQRGREALLQAVAAAGFHWVDLGLLAREEQARLKTQFGFFGLFVDHIHLSPYGTARLADELLPR